MKASDLRIGNWIEVFYGNGDKRYQQVDFISENLIECKPNLNIYGNTIKYKPIPLTEEWLLKFGWVKENNYLWCEDVPYSVKMKFKKDGSIWLGNVLEVHFGSGFSKKRNNGVKYIHQLQNLYFALTGEELKLKTK